MLRKTLSVFLVLCTLCCCALPAAAVRETGVIRVRLHSDIAGLTESDEPEKMIELLTDNVVYSYRAAGPVSFADYAGTPVFDDLKAGRTYDLSYCLDAAEGYALPETIGEGDVQIECGKNVWVYSTQITTARIRNDDGSFTTYKGLRIQAQVVVDGNIFQRIIGFLYDIYLKIRAWSLY